MIFRFFAPYPYLLLEDIEFWFHTIQSQLRHKKKEKKKKCVKFSNSWCNRFKFVQKSQKGEGFALCTVYGSDFSVAREGENDINREKDTSQHKGYVDAAQPQRKLTDFGASSANKKLD